MQRHRFFLVGPGFSEALLDVGDTDARRAVASEDEGGLTLLVRIGVEFLEPDIQRLVGLSGNRGGPWLDPGRKASDGAVEIAGEHSAFSHFEGYLRTAESAPEVVRRIELVLENEAGFTHLPDSLQEMKEASRRL